MAIFYQLLPFLLIPLHLLLIFAKGYFLSAEFTLYPYLVSRGLLPYKDIIDQHFPSLFFGPFSLPYFLTDHPVKLLLLFLSVLALGDWLLYRFLIKTKSPHPIILLLLYILVSVYFSGHILWVEVFVNLFLLIWLNLRGNKLQQLLSGFLLSQIILMRPTFAPALFFLFFSFGKIGIHYLLGGFVGFLLPVLYLQINHLWTNFYNLAFIFNSQIYPIGAKLFPSLREMVIVSTLFISSFWKNKKPFLLLAVISSLILAYPRFGLEHLQPFVLIAILVISEAKKIYIVYFLIFVFGLLNPMSLFRHHYGNYFYPPELYSLSDKVKNLPGNNIYLLGASDLIYPLANKLPLNNFYLPSLPWYLNYPAFQSRLFVALDHPGSYVLVDNDFSVDGKKLSETSPAIIKFVQSKFNLIEQFGRYSLYQIKP